MHAELLLSETTLEEVTNLTKNVSNRTIASDNLGKTQKTKLNNSIASKSSCLLMRLGRLAETHTQEHILRTVKR